MSSSNTPPFRETSDVVGLKAALVHVTFQLQATKQATSQYRLLSHLTALVFKMATCVDERIQLLEQRILASMRIARQESPCLLK